LAAQGNHESGPATLHNLFDTPNEKAYYALSFGGDLLRVWTLNTEIPIGGAQTDWLKADLARHAGVTWKIAQYHRPMRPHNARKRDGARQYAQWAVPFHEAGMQAVFEGDA